MSESLVPVKESQESIGPSLMVSGMTPSSLLYHRPATSTNPHHDLNVLSVDTLDPNSPSLANEQYRKQLIALYENDEKMLKEKLSRVQSILSMLKNYTSQQPRRIEHLPTLVRLPANLPNLPNLDVTSCAERNPLEPTLKELQTLSTIDEGTGQKVLVNNGPGEFLGNSAPTMAEIKAWCSISD